MIWPLAIAWPSYLNPYLTGKNHPPLFILPAYQIHPALNLHQSFDSFQSVSRTVNNGATDVIGREIYLSSIKELPRGLPRPWEIGAIIRRGQLTCRHYWWSAPDTSLMLALAFSLSWGSCQERLVSQSPCQQGGLIWAAQPGHFMAAERERERQSKRARDAPALLREGPSWCSSTWWEHGDLAVLRLINTAGLFCQ